MNIHHKFNKQLDYISMFNGVGLNIEEKLKLEISINELHKDSQAEEVLFWGKITGTKFDYYIALLINYKGHFEFPKKSFYYTTSNTWVFNQLPEIKRYHIEDLEAVCNQTNNNINKDNENNNDENNTNASKSLFFIGEPNTVIKEHETEKEQLNNSKENAENDSKPVNPDPLDISDSEDNKVVEVEKKLNFTELDRLSFMVKIIDYETNIFPQGAFKLIPIHELRRNDHFKGLKKEELKDISKYSHFRKASQKDKIDNIEKDEAIFKQDILDDIGKDKTKNIWTFQLDSTKSIVNIRNLLWPGYFAFHKSDSNLYGGVYIGNGLKNSELPFMI